MADEAADRQAIRAVVKALNDVPRPTGLFTPGADRADLLTELLQYKPKVIISHEPWGEIAAIRPGTPTITERSIRFITSDFALADAAWVNRNPGEAQTRPLLLLMKRVDSTWKIISLRELAPLLVR